MHIPFSDKPVKFYNLDVIISIDRLGNLGEVKSYLKEKIGQDIEICW